MSETAPEVKTFTGRVYRIDCSCGCGQCYVGTTICSLSKRMSQHRERCKKGERTHKLYVHMREKGIEKFNMYLIEQIECKTKDELRAREGHWIRQLDSASKGLNERVAGRTNLQNWYDNKEKYSALRSEYYRNNIEKEKETRRIYRESHQAEIAEYKKKWAEENRKKKTESKKMVVDISDNEADE